MYNRSVSVNLNQKIFCNEEKECIENFKKFVNYILKISNPIYDYLKEDFLEEIQSLFVHIESLINTSENYKTILKLLSDNDLIKIYIKIIEFCFNFLVDTVNEIRLYQSSNTKQQIDNLSSNCITIYNSLNGLMQLSLCLSNFCLPYQQSFHSLNGTIVLLKMLSDEIFLECFILLNNAQKLQNFDNHLLMKSIIGTLHNLTKSVSIQDLNATNILLSLAHKMKEMKLDLMQIYLILANILTDTEIGKLTDTIDIVNKIADMIRTCSKNMQIVKENSHDVSYVEDNSRMKWDLNELISGIYRIAINDEIKYYVYCNCKINEVIEIIVEYGALVEKEHALKLLYQLSFDDNVADLIRNDESMIKLIESYAAHKSNQNNSKFLEYSKNLLWRIQSKHSLNLKNKPHSGAQKQIMISYNTKTRDVCMKIKTELEKIGFKIWIDVENIYGSSLQAMASAIEESDLIIICMFDFEISLKI